MPKQPKRIKKDKPKANSKKDQFLVPHVTPELKIMAKKAADKSGVFLYEWVIQVLTQEAQRVLTSKQEVTRPEDNLDLGKVYKSMMEEISKISQKVDALEKPKPSLFGIFRKSA